ncbi:MAG: YciI family protein [Bacteroidetes bacterium]|nr:YciI family protein [Bacteroidota bacterium]
MKTLSLIFTFVFLFQINQSKAQAPQTDSLPANPNYDENLAKKLGADAFGMKKYKLVILKTGATTSTDKSLIEKSFNGHMENINRLVKEEKLIVAGPLSKNEKTYRGIFIFQGVETNEELQKILQTDPAIAAGFLDFEIYTWYGSAALPEYLPISDKIWKSKP